MRASSVDNLIELLPVAAAIVDADGRAAAVNDPFARLLGMPVASLTGVPLRDFAHPDDRERFARALACADEAATQVTMIGKGRAVEATVSVRVVEGVRCAVVVERHGGLRDAEGRFRGAFEHAPTGMALLGDDGRVERANPALGEILGRPADALRGEPLPWLDGTGHLDALTDGSADALSLEFPGDPVWAALDVRAIRDGRGRPARLVAQVQDVSERRRYEDRLRFVADHDHLTGLLNRRGFEAVLDAHLARDGAGALVLLDIDHFKYVNDEAGHQVGDRMLEAVGAEVAARACDPDVGARLGGDEFALLLPQADGAAACRAAEALVRAVRELRVDGLPDTHVTASAGVAPVECAQTPGQLLALADLAMYDAKDGGRDRVRRHDAGSRTRHRMTWRHRIQRALADDQLLLFRQPIVGVHDGAASHHELLVRLPGGVSPGVWFEVAERYGLATAIDEWVLSRACDLLRADPAGPGLNVNVSATTIGRARLIERLREELGRSGLDPARLTLEITETAAIENIAAAARFVEDLHDLGCRCALDDFGAGFGSFYYLKHLPVDDVKIDGEFVRDSVNDARDRTILRAMVDAAASMGRRTVAECIEDEPTLGLMREYDVDLVQGYFLGRPAPV